MPIAEFYYLPFTKALKDLGIGLVFFQKNYQKPVAKSIFLFVIVVFNFRYILNYLCMAGGKTEKQNDRL